mmetsp:Transcript_18116/g.31764  ORF Transcript_18116/g.31764 Transcript_18116/m.31764 type:complete len:188 (-) Transcript_18116:78-641(-)|eukprot:CAMPEP_0197647560 /NCGR_PEP_ID=MMETSP1338-20131121/25793_1 /TAXON_ID=43686 ORGANISM="Pelagodinium beii, Strain RCC1491" /NCGR_SAMPLE_ID=MMETSP1338 /ASSEMBLY_ACC=CAM_ASM_000754 /LENGTH=187 /DNA_ID=CAMNT_0043221389 /DNA_START=67 /DNA_END=630 /DNA_ORIENTATION=-
MASAGPGNVIGAAAKEFATEEAKRPEIQAAAWNTARDAASQGAAHARAGLIEVRSYVQESHCSVQVLCFCTALALLIASVLSVINVFQAVFNPFRYLFAFWNAIFAICIIIMDGKSTWFERSQQKLFSAAAFLSGPRGRAVFYLYVGSINVGMFKDSWFYAVVGIILCVISVIMLSSSCRQNEERLP